MPDNNKGIKQLWGYDLIDSKARNAISSTRSSLENDFQKKTDDTLGTTSKTIPGAINEIKDSVDNLDGKFSVEQTDTKYDMKYNGKTIANIGLTLTDDQIAGGDGSFDIDLTPYQTKNDDNLNTTNKTIVGSINEVNTQCKDIVDKKIDTVALSDNTLTFLANNKNIKTITLPSTTGGTSDTPIKTISSKVLTTVPASDIKIDNEITINNISINKDRRYYIEFLGSKKLCSVFLNEEKETSTSIICSIGNYSIQAYNDSTNIKIGVSKINEDDTTTDTFTDLVIYEEEVKYLDSKYLETDLVLQNSISLGRVGDIGVGSSAIGVSILASGVCSHAEGNGTMASGYFAHAEGGETKASGMASHAEGATTTASGDLSHAEGGGTVASGMISHAEGNNTVASSDYQHVQGKYNVVDSNGAYAHIVGNGEDDSTRANAHTVDWEGNAWYAGEVQATNLPYTVSSKVLTTVPAGDIKIDDNIAINNISINKDRRYYIEFLGTKKLCNLLISEEIGNCIICSIGGYIIQAFNNSNNISLSVGKINEEATTDTFTDLVIYEEEVKYLDSKYLETDLVLQNSISLGRVGDIGPGSSAVGMNVEASGIGAHAEGEGTKALGAFSHAEGNSTKASGDSSHAEGESTTASGDSSHAEGNNTTASGTCSHAEGDNTVASGNSGSHAEGASTKALGAYGSHAEGINTIASGSSSHAEGNFTVASGDSSHTEGNNTIASGENQHVQGKYNIEDTNNKYAHIVGNGNSSKASNAHTLDWEGNAWFAGKLSQEGTPTEDKDLTTKKYVDNNRIGYIRNETAAQTIDTSAMISSFTNNSYTYETNNVTYLEMGNEYHVIVNGVRYRALCINNLPGKEQIYETISVNGDGFSIAIMNKMGYKNKYYEDNTKCAYEIKLSDELLATPPIIEILKMDIEYIPTYLMPKDLEILNSISVNRIGKVGTGSAAIGYKNTASDDFTFAMGISTTANATGAHSEGGYTVANGSYSHAEGFKSKSTGQYSHVEGIVSESSGQGSHAEGYYTVASGMRSHSEGGFTEAASQYQHVQGKYNVVDSNGTYAHIVGNGTDKNNRHNAHTLDWEGNAWYAGKLSQEGTPTKDKDLVTKKYVDTMKTDIDSIKTELGTDTLNTTAQDLKGAINEVFQNVSNGKQLIATAITDKGVTTSSDSTFQTMANNIKNISSANINVEGFTTYTLFETDENIPDTWIGTNGGKGLVLSSDDFLNTFYDNLVTTNNDYGTVTKTALGKDESQTYTIYEYDFKPKNWNRMILLSSGMHPYELPASFGLAYFMKYVMTSNNPAMKYIRENVRIKVIPIINPWGWNQNPRKYGTVNGVNINRNCDPMGLWEKYKGNTTEWNQKGTSAFSENETKVLRNWLSRNKGAEFYIDCHTGVGAFPDDVTNALYYLSDSPIKTQIESALTKLNNWITSKYGVTGKANSNCAQSPTGVFDYGITDYAEKNLGIPGFTIEQRPESTAFGTSAVNEGADIKHYITSISTYVMELLLKQPEDITKNTVIQMKQSIIELNKDETNYIELEVSDYYRITNNLTNCTSSNSATTVDKNSAYNATITANNNYTISTINVTMGGVDITSTAVNSNIITIPQVTGDIIITAKATSNTPLQLEKFDFNLANINTGDTSITDSANNKTLNIVGTDWTKNDDGSITFGSNSYLRYDNGLGTEDNKLFTVVLDMSANLSSSGTEYTMLWGDFNSDNDGIFFMCDTAKFYFKDYSKGTSAQVVYSGALDRDKYLLIYDGSQFILRTKTTVLGTCSLDNLTIPAHAKVYFGNTNTLSKNMDGKLYEIKWYNKVLSDEEIQAL